MSNHDIDHICIQCANIYDLRMYKYCPTCTTSYRAYSKSKDDVYYIGIDPGVRTGVATIFNGKYESIETFSILDAMIFVREIIRVSKELGYPFHLYIENPNLRKYFGNTGREKLQGAGSIKRDYSIWQEFATKEKVSIIPVAPKDVGSIFDNITYFKAATGWTNRTSKHSRDAAKIIFQHYKQ